MAQFISLASIRINSLMLSLKQAAVLQWFLGASKQFEIAGGENA
jgi:hypothetical protein